MKFTSAPARMWLVPLATAAFLISACGSSSSSNGAGAAASTTSGGAASAATAPAASTSGGSASSGGAAVAAVTIATKTGPLGTYLVDGTGRTIYLWVADTGSTSTCSGQCAVYWPPVTGAAKASGSVQAAALATSKRADGTSQVTYDGHPLYYFAGDKSAGSTSGQGTNGFGAKWWVVGVDGKAITQAAAAASSTKRSGY